MFGIKRNVLGALTIGVLASFAVGTGVAQADDTTLPGPPSPTSSATINKGVAQPGVMDKIRDNVYFSYWLYYQGPSTADPGNNFQPDVNGNIDPGSIQKIENLDTVGFKLNKDYLIGALVHNYYSPLGSPTGVGTDNWNWLDPALTFYRYKPWDLGNGLKVKASFSATVPLSSYDTLKKNGLATGLTPLLNSFWDIPNTRWTIGLYTYFTAYIPDGAAIDNYRTLKFYVAPNFSYQLTKTVAATLWVDGLQITRKAHTGFLSGMHNEDMDFEPGVSWDVTSFLTVVPMLNIYPTSLTWRATSFQANIVGRVL